MKLKLENTRISLWNIFLEKMEMTANGSALDLPIVIMKNSARI